MPRNPNCKRCPLHLAAKTVCVPGTGNSTPGGLMLLAEAPGAEEDTQGRPFVGSAGRVLDELLAAVGHTRKEVWLSNAGARCRPPANRTPTTAETNACFIYTAEEIEQVQPAVILCLGGAALKALTGKDGVAANRGKQVPGKPGLRLGDAKIFVTFHPAAILHPHNPAEKQRIKESIVQDLQLAFAMVSPSESIDHVRCLLPPGYSADKLLAALDTMSSCKVVAADLEWSALPGRGMSWPWSKGAELFSFSISGRRKGKIYSLAFSWPPPDYALQGVKDFFAKVPTVWHNALADLNWTESVGVKTKIAGDTLILAFLMDEEQRLALEQLAPLYTDVKPGWKIGPWAERPPTREGWEELLLYNSQDTEATILLAEALHKRLESLPDHEKQGIKRIYYHLLLPALPTMVSMALRGIPMDEEGLDRELASSYKNALDLEEKIGSIVGGHPGYGIAIARSPTQTLDYLNSAYGLEIDTSNKDDLAAYASQYPIIGLIQQYRWERNKVQGTYLGPWQELLKEQGDGRLHSVYRLTYARTGRTSAEIEKGGSLQLMPREQAGRDLQTRHLVKARPGYQIVAADASQVELRIMAWFSNDQAMIQLFKEGADLHAATAAFIKSRLPLEEFWPERFEHMKSVTKDERQAAKGANFGLIFGLQPDGLMEYSKKTYGVDMTIEEAIHAHEAYFKIYTGVKAYHDYCRRVLFTRGYTETPFGRFRRRIEEPNKAINTPIQSTASDLSLYSMTNIDKRFRGWPAYVIGFVHDSVLCEVQEDYVDKAKGIILEEMEHPDLRPLGVLEVPVPLKADVLVGPTWGDAS